MMIADVTLRWTKPSIIRFVAIVVCGTLTACSTMGKAPPNIGKQLTIAEELIALGEVDRAYRILDKLSVDPNTAASTQVEIGNHFLEMNALVRAKRAYFAAGELGDELAANIGFGKLALKENDAKTAMMHFQSALDQAPESNEALNGIGVSLDLQGQHVSARDYYNQVLEFSPADVRTLNNLSLSLILDGSALAAVNKLQGLSESHLANQTVLANLAIGLSLTGYRRNANDLAGSMMSEEDAERIFKAVRRYIMLNS